MRSRNLDRRHGTAPKETLRSDESSRERGRVGKGQTSNFKLQGDGGGTEKSPVPDPNLLWFGQWQYRCRRRPCMRVAVLLPLLVPRRAPGTTSALGVWLAVHARVVSSLSATAVACRGLDDHCVRGL